MLVTNCAWCGKTAGYSLDFLAYCAECGHQLGVSQRSCGCLSCIPLGGESDAKVSPPARTAEEESPGIGLEFYEDLEQLGVVSSVLESPVVCSIPYPGYVVVWIVDSSDRKRWLRLVITENQLDQLKSEMSQLG